MFHMLSHTDGEGGASQLVDGFRAARKLQRANQEAYGFLSQMKFMSHASGNDGISIQPQLAFPVLRHDPISGTLAQVRWNNADRAAFVMKNRNQATDLENWYRAAK